MLLIGRTGKISAGNKQAVQMLSHTAHSASVSIIKGDLAAQEESQMRAATAVASDKVFQGVVHASGILADATLQKQTLAGVRAVFASKLVSMQRLGAAFMAQPIMQQLLFSSVAALLGSPGQANYSAANGALDGLAAHLTSQVTGPM